MDEKIGTTDDRTKEGTEEWTEVQPKYRTKINNV